LLSRACTAPAAFRRRNLGQRQQQRLIQRGLRALRLRIELAHRLDLIAKEIDANRPVGISGEYTSRMPPRRANCPGISTRSTCE
jgi:hypothetical protein